MLGLSTGLSALRVNQRALDIVGQNIANANTPGYHRQIVNLVTRSPVELDGLSIGTGVEITDVRRLHSSLLETALAQQTSESSDTASRLDTLRHIESLVGLGDGSIHDTMEKFFNGLEQLSTRPGDVTIRRILLGTATALTSQFNYVSGEFDRLRSNLDNQIGGVVGEINSVTQQIADLNLEIQRSGIRGIAANDLLDQQEQLQKQLAELTGFRTTPGEQGQASIFLEGAPLVVSNHATPLTVSAGPDGDTVVTAQGMPDPLAISGGKLGALLELQNTILPGYQDRVDTLAHTFIGAINGVHATGLGLDGPATFLAGTQAVSSNSVPLEQADLPFPPQAGSLFMTVTNLATGQRTLSEIAVNPATQSLDDLANSLSAVTGVQAIADPQTQKLMIRAVPGYAFDFAGQLASSPASVSITGTTVPQIAGSYAGTANDTYTFRVVGTGTIGVTPNLSLEVRNSAGTVIGSMNIGEGYEPGSTLDAPDGLQMQLSAGTANDGDSFTARVIGQPDTAGVLGALGLGGVFLGSTARDIRVNDELVLDPTRFAASRTGAAGDGSNLERMASVRDEPLLAGGTQTLREAYAELASDVGANIQNLSELQDHQELMGQRLEAERQSLSGVDPNEELVKMVQFQRSFQIAAKYINVVSETLDELTRLV